MIFNGIRSDELGLVIQQMPSSPRAKEKISSIHIPGRSGTLHEFENAFENYTLSLECLVTDLEQIDKIAALFRGAGEVIFSDDLTKKYKVVVVNQIDMVYAATKFKSFLLQLDTHPFKFSASPLDDEIIATSAVIFHNKGTFESEPIIEVFGLGTVTLVVNDRSYRIKNISGSVTINSEMMEVYKDDRNKNNDFEAEEFPTFNTGENTIRWSGNVSKVVIQPNWRWL
ncbi:MAG: phage tail family protein [Peptostreptococcaceae bacterium]|nr:phage tail family protein [Peptostreptococcaceae bacterium]